MQPAHTIDREELYSVLLVERMDKVWIFIGILVGIFERKMLSGE